MISEYYRNEKWLREQYEDKNQSIREIAEKIGCTKQTVSNLLEEFDIREKPDRYISQHPDRYNTNNRCRYRICPKNTSSYPKWTATGTGSTVRVHNLVAIADGADPHIVFDDNEYQVHHRNSFKCDSRPENLELLTDREHGHKSANGDNWSDDDLRVVIRAMINVGDL